LGGTIGGFFGSGAAAEMKPPSVSSDDFFSGPKLLSVVGFFEFCPVTIVDFPLFVDTIGLSII
jgi:hypothetical protein